MAPSSVWLPGRLAKTKQIFHWDIFRSTPVKHTLRPGYLSGKSYTQPRTSRSHAKNVVKLWQTGLRCPGLANRMEENDKDQLASFEKMGVTEVRLRVASPTGFNETNRRLAYKWLTQKDQESLRLREAAQAELAATASRAAAAAEAQAREAEKANTRATVALVIAIIGIIISAASRLHPLH
jgi:hypothetical protein